MRLKSLTFIFFFTGSIVSAQQTTLPTSPVEDTGRIVLIHRAEKSYFIKQDSLTEKTILVGNVFMQQGTTLFYCDSAVRDQKLNIIEAFGNIHINDGDSVHTYSQYLKFYGDTRMASLRKKVKLTDGKGVLTTEELDYDLNSKIGTYTNGGKLVNGSSVLTSREGYYYADTREAYFTNNVKLVDPEYTMATDTLLYNVDQQIATFVAATTINDGKTNIYTRSGYYDLKNGTAKFGKRPIIEDSTQTIIAEDIQYDKKTGNGIAKGSVIYRDTAQGTTILAGLTEFNSNTKQVLATQKPVMILKQNNDSIYIAGDTLVSELIAKVIEPKKDSLPVTDTLNNVEEKNIPLTDSISLLPVSDTVKGVQVKTDVSADSIRFFKAFHHVRIFSDSLQGVCDSLSYSAQDSVFRFYKDPVIWAKESQISGDTIYLFTKNKTADQIFVFENAYSINKTPETLFNQIRGNRLNGYFKEGSIDYIRAKGNAESVYYLQDDDSAYLGMNYARADAISLYFANKELKKVTWVYGVEGTTYPFQQIPEDKKTLRNFNWQETRRPKTKYELFGD
jgi:lipopolysaccharide export system protein LptA